MDWLDTSNPLVVVVLNLFTATLGFLAGQFWLHARTRRGELTGYWVARHLSHGEVEKVDRVHVRQRGTSIDGDIRRVSPQVESKKRWRFVGESRDGRLVGYYWPAGNQFSSRSYGVFLMKKGGNVLEGYYFQSHTAFVASESGVEAYDMDGYRRFRLRWERDEDQRSTLMLRLSPQRSLERESLQ